ncbi:hypothetical protein FQR65_LT00573 [Abscondita terminalis]|nr:hypothetical protein FQR65_LT00573 [Abscondita terminalis]
MMKCDVFCYFLLSLIANSNGISTNFNQAEISEEDRRAAEALDKTKTVSPFKYNLSEENGRKFALATTYHKEGQILIPRLAASYKKKEMDGKESEHETQNVNYYGYKPQHGDSSSRIGYPGFFSQGTQYQDRGILYGNSGYSHSGPSSYGHSGGGEYYYPSQHGLGFGHGGFLKKFGLKGLLIPLAGIALLGAAAALTANPVLLQLGTLNGKRRRRSIKPHILNSNIYPINPYIKPIKK